MVNVYFTVIMTSADNLTSIFKFDNNVTANFNINAFTKESDKKIRLIL